MASGAQPALIETAPLPTGKVIYMDPDSPNLKVDESKNGRAYPYVRDDVLDLLESIPVHGVIEPVMARPLGKGVYELYIGYRRHKACQIINQERLAEAPVKLPVMVTELNPAEAFLRNLDENNRRRDTTIVDDAHNIRRLQEVFGIPMEQIQEIYSRGGKKASPEWVTQTLKVLRFPSNQQERFHRERVARSYVHFVADIPDPEMREQVMQEAEEEYVQEVVKDIPGSLDEAKQIIAEATQGAPVSPNAIVERVEKAARSKGLTKAKAQKLAQAAKKLSRPKPEVRHAQKAAVKLGAVSDMRFRKLSDVKDLFMRHCGPGVGPAAKRRFFNHLLDWAEGKIDTKKVDQEIDKLFKG